MQVYCRYILKNVFNLRKLKNVYNLYRIDDLSFDLINYKFAPKFVLLIRNADIILFYLYLRD